jgi:hypothetical protein
VIMGGKVWVCAAALAVAGIPQQPLRAQEPYARATVDSTHYLVGDAIPVHVQISHDAGVAVRSLFADTLGGFTILGSTPFHSEGEKVTAGDVVVAKYDSGDAVLPPLQFLLTAPADTAGKRVATNELRLTIQTVAVDTSQDIKDLKAPLGIPLTWQEILLACAVVLGVVVAGYLLSRWWKRRQMRVSPAYTAPAKPAHVIAFEELGALKEKKLWQQGLIKPYYTEVADILRRYFENRYRLMALERTTDEILDDLHRIRMNNDLVGRADRLLRRADLVKFAKHLPAAPEHDESMQIVYDVVERTRIRESIASPGAGGKADVGA